MILDAMGPKGLLEGSSRLALAARLMAIDSQTAAHAASVEGATERSKST